MSSGGRRDPDQARELLADERTRIERALAHLGPQDMGKPADEVDTANLASELYEDEFEEGLAAVKRVRI